MGAVLALVALGLGVGTACSSTPSGATSPPDAGATVDAAAAVDAAVPIAEAAPPPDAEAGACNGLAKACGQGAGECCAQLTCGDLNRCCAPAGEACTRSAECCQASACVAGKCAPAPAPPGCYQKRSAVYPPPTAAAPRRTPGLCTSADIATFETACLGSGGRTASDCVVALSANPTCGRCLFADVPGDPPTTPLGALMLISLDRFTLNTAACAALVIGRPDCAVPVAQEVSCLASACESCANEADDAACTAAAEADVCKSPVDLACDAALAATAAQWTPICRGTDFLDGYRKLAKELCGAP